MNTSNAFQIFFDEKEKLWVGYFKSNPYFKIKGKTKEELTSKLGLIEA